MFLPYDILNNWTHVDNSETSSSNNKQQSNSNKTNNRNALDLSKGYTRCTRGRYYIRPYGCCSYIFGL